MIVEIRDRDALLSISTWNLRAYLHSRCWTKVGAWGERPITIFSKDHAGRTWEILVPHRDTIGGYAENMAESVSVLAAVEERSELDVFYDLAAIGADVIQVRSTNGKAKESLSLRDASDMLSDTCKMLEAGARSVERPRATHRGRLSAEVAAYLDSVHPLPIYAQGYALTLHSPVPMGFERQEDLGDDFLPPFSRRVTMKLAQGLRLSGEALGKIVSGDAFSDDSLEPFREAVDSGVSANLCDSLAALAKQGDGVAIKLAWSGVRPSSEADSSFRFSTTDADILTEAAKSLRLKEPAYDDQIVGLVVRLEREPSEFDGRATIAAVRDGQVTRMDVEFERDTYDVVIRSFKDQTRVSLEGDVHRSGRGYELRNPRNLLILPGE